MEIHKNRIGEEGYLEESMDQKLYGDYQLYIQLKDLKYTNIQIANQLYCTVEELEKLKAMFE